MAFTAEDLLVGRAEPVTATADEIASDVLDRMIQYDYSQLPVVDAHRRPIGMVSSDAILRALSHFGVGLRELRVADAIDRVRPRRLDEDVLGTVAESVRRTLQCGPP